jgi:hypothetical protein
VLYLGIDGGGYDIVVRNQVGVVLWWIVLIGAAWGVLPFTRLTRSAWAGLAVFGAFVAWTAVASTWSLSSERSLDELSRVSCYLAVPLLGVSIYRDRTQAIRQTVNAVGTAVVVIAGLALTSRLVPGAFPASHVTGTFLVGVRARLSWPLNYWNGLAALIALGLPLVLSIATSARTLRAQAAAAAALPLLGLCSYLTFSRGGAIAAVIALLAFIALSPDRLAKLATILVAAAGSAVLIAGAIHRTAVEHGLTNHLAAKQGSQLIVVIALVCGAVALAQAGIGLAARHGTLPRSLRVSPSHARALFAGAILVAVVAALAAGAPSRLSHAWSDFKHQRTVGVVSPSRFGSTAGNGRYQMWRVAVNTTSAHRLDGSGPGTFQLLWEPRAPFYTYVVNAHSLYFETLAELGVVGLGLLIGFISLVLISAGRLVNRSHDDVRVRAAAAAAALLAFAVSAFADWVWQLPVLPVAFLLIAGGVFAPAQKRSLARPMAQEPRPTDADSGIYRPSIGLRAGLVVLAVACLVAIGVPLATTAAVRKSQAAVLAGAPSAALGDAQSAVRIEPGAVSAQLQVALVFELERNLPGAVQAATTATRDEPQNWSTWLILSRLEAEAGHAQASVAAYRRARSLNPRSPLFRQ